MGTIQTRFYILALALAISVSATPWPQTTSAFRMYEKGVDDVAGGLMSISASRKSALAHRPSAANQIDQGVDPLLQNQGRSDSDVARPNTAIELQSPGTFDANFFSHLENNYATKKVTLDRLLPYNFERLYQIRGDLTEGVPSKPPTSDYPTRAIGGYDLDTYKQFKQYLTSVHKAVEKLLPAIQKLSSERKDAASGDQSAKDKHSTGLVGFFGPTSGVHNDVAELRILTVKQAAAVRERLANTHSNIKEFLYFYGNLDEFVAFASKNVPGEVRLALFPRFSALKNPWHQVLRLNVEAFAHSLRVVQVLMAVLGGQLATEKHQAGLAILEALAEEAGLLSFYAHRVDEMDSAHQAIDLELDQLMENFEHAAYGKHKARKERHAHRQHVHFALS